MANATVQINNETSGYLSIDAEIAPKKNIRVKLNPRGTAGASADVGDIATLSELNTNAQIQSLLSASPPKISVSVARGGSDLPGSDVTAVVDSSGMDSASPRLVVSIAAGAAGARDVTLYSAALPFACRLVDAQIMVNTAVAGSLTVRDALAGGGNALSQALSTAATGRVQDNGTGQTAGAGIVPSLAKNSSLIARMSAGDAACTLILDFVRLS